MNVRLIKAMQRCCDKADGGRLGQPTLVHGELCATDKIVAVRYRERDWERDKMPRVPWQIWAHEIEGLKPSQSIGVTEKGFRIPGKDSHGYPDEQYPDLVETWKWLEKGQDPDYPTRIDPTHAIRVLRVFEAAGAYPTIRNMGNMTTFEGWCPKTGASIQAIVMGMRDK